MATVKHESAEYVGNCELIAEVGAGGMAVVYRAVQQPLGRSVAVKRLRPDLSRDPDLVQRFRREALSVANVQHENIVSIFDFLADESRGEYAMILEYVEGIDLHELLDRCGRLPWDVAAIIGLKIASALEYAHYRKIVHRDIKPSNVMISLKGEVKLTDFGIAKDMTFDDMTRTGMAIGTPSYMSPEQVVGARLDFKSDLFSFGILLYQMLSGEKPFVEDERSTVLEKIRDEACPPLRKKAPTVPRSLARIVERCLEKRAEDRWQVTAHLRQALEQVVARHVHINYSGRLVAFLCHRGIIDADEAAHFVETSVLDDAEMQRVDAGGPPTPPLWPLLAGFAAVGLVIFLWIAVLHAGLLGPPEPAQSPLVTDTREAGFLKVVVDPWAHVYVDGAYVDTTPFARALPLTEGEHRILLKNDYLGEEEYRVRIRKGEESTLNVSLRE
ncbi:MAG: serine/threonine protein kinase [Deltaproteobacteria bacterium]|nr:MAG: serine/threonine protein kinase [Deltaproteobacteria bacterium]